MVIDLGGKSLRYQDLACSLINNTLELRYQFKMTFRSPDTLRIDAF